MQEAKQESVENNSTTTKSAPMQTKEGKLLGGITGKGFRPGQSGNPGGRPKGLAKYVRELTKDGKEIAEFMYRIFRGEKIDGKEPKLQDRIQAANWLAERGFGKPTQPIAGDEEFPPVLSLSDAELKQLYAFVVQTTQIIQAEGEKKALQAGEGEILEIAAEAGEARAAAGAEKAAEAGAAEPEAENAAVNAQKGTKKGRKKAEDTFISPEAENPA